MNITKSIAKLSVALTQEGYVDEALQLLEASVEKDAAWDGKFVTPYARLTWSNYGFKIEELPIKGKKRLRIATLSHSDFDRGQLRPTFIVNDYSNLNKRDTYDQIKDKILRGFEEASANVGNTPNYPYSWREELVHYLKITPENIDPLKIEALDFTVNSTWTKFKAFSPGSDFQQADPHYVVYESTSPQSARKLYRILSANPNALARVSWLEFASWLKKNKIKYETNFSVWR